VSNERRRRGEMERNEDGRNTRGSEEEEIM
jgi:hypothetical protein